LQGEDWWVSKNKRSKVRFKIVRGNKRSGRPNGREENAIKMFEKGREEGGKKKKRRKKLLTEGPSRKKKFCRKSKKKPLLRGTAGMWTKTCEFRSWEGGEKDEEVAP